MAWIDEKYRNLTFINAPNNDLAEWLGNNGEMTNTPVKQADILFYGEDGSYLGYITIELGETFTVPSYSSNVAYGIVVINANTPGKVEINDIEITGEIDYIVKQHINDYKGDRLYLFGASPSELYYIEDKENDIVSRGPAKLYESTADSCSYAIHIARGAHLSNEKVNPLWMNFSKLNLPDDLTLENANELLAPYIAKLVAGEEIDIRVEKLNGKYVVNDSYGKAKFYNPNDIHDNYAERQEGVAMSLIQRLSVLKGELWYQINNGMPLLEKVRSKEIIDSYIISAVLNHPDCNSFSSFNSSVENKHDYHCTFKVNTIYGEVELSI